MEVFLIGIFLIIIFFVYINYRELHHKNCGGKWVFLRYGRFGHYDKCSKCGIEVYETDN